MKLSATQMQAIENGEAVPITVGRTKCVLLRADLYQRVKALLDLEATYPLLDKPGHNILSTGAELIDCTPYALSR